MFNSKYKPNKAFIMKKWERDTVKERIDTEYWLDLNGKPIRWKETLKEANEWSSLHTAIAMKLLSRFENIKNGKISATDILHKRGYIAMGSAVYGMMIKGEPTQGQINYLYDLGFKYIKDENGVKHSW